MKLPQPFPNPFNWNAFRNCRGTRYLGAAVFVGKGPMARAHMHATAGVQDVPASFKWAPDPERLARELEVDTFVPNTGRTWTFDHGELQNGYVIDFHGARMGWLGEMTGEDCVAHFQPAYPPTAPVTLPVGALSSRVRLAPATVPVAWTRASNQMWPTRSPSSVRST